MIQQINHNEFLEKSDGIPVIDVRSPKEFLRGHIPDAINLPLFDDDERKNVGTLYKKSGKEASLLLSLDIAGPKLSYFVKTARKLSPDREILIHCWRGGMRSASMAWLFETADFKVFVLNGGYKAYRKYIRQKIGEEANLIVVGGKTGCGKSEILNYLAKAGEQVLDLENIAHHKGSAFGDLGQEKQPTNEQFENNLFQAWQKLDLNLPVWIEDESRGIGTVSIPEPLYNKIRQSPVIFLDVEKEIRITRLVKEYALFDPALLEAAILRINKKLGGLNTKLTIEALFNKDFNTAASILLTYYDKAYLKGLSMREQKKVFKLELHKDNPALNTQLVVEYARKIL
ncbi:MAG: tRNA 2-selenouridine(34) synthase MnmH [Bacteroidetes bacterium]|nr:tRNA 2-selenouridine(34) synthase MnmH [Bacteroidota bacterium]MBL7104940.1 tRNA 2-selenouridine(34) synthase MnmH [Bacteroidales bacterium]